MKTAIVALALAASFTALANVAIADEMPIKGVCVKGNETVEFAGSRMPERDPLTGSMGVTRIWMSLHDYGLMLSPHVDSLGDKPNSKGFVPAAIGEVGVSVATDPDGDRVELRASNRNFQSLFEEHDKWSTSFFEWKCQVDSLKP